LGAQQDMPAQRFEWDIGQRSGERERQDLRPRDDYVESAEIDDVPMIEQR
jgi:hypothetical protein